MGSGSVSISTVSLWHLACGIIVAELITKMELAKFRWRRLAAALGIGFGVEGVVFFAIIVIANFLPQWADVIGEWPLQPASYLVTLLAKAEHPGFEDQVGYFLLTVVLQWLIYSAVVYSLLAVSSKKRSTAGAIKEISNQ
jgi:hypothetical protein